MEQEENAVLPVEKGGKLLVVDENSALLRTTKAMFANSTWCCETCQDSITALCAIVEQKPSAVLIDSEAGPLDAWKFCLLVKEHPQYQNLRVLVLSRQDNVLIRAKARAAGADALMLKPFTAEEVIALLESRDGMAA